MSVNPLTGPETPLKGVVLEEILDLIFQNTIRTKRQLERLKIQVSKRRGLIEIPKNSELLEAYRRRRKIRSKHQSDEWLFELLQKKPIRTRSGVAIVAVMAAPYPCPGKCIYCPEINGVPKSYVGREPAALRGKQNNFDPYLQVKQRLTQYYNTGHPTDKIQLIIMGGTFLATPLTYQGWFVQQCLEAITGIRANSFSEAVRHAETSKVRNIGITFETRPDYCCPVHVDRMLELGGTWVELGVQTLSDETYQKIQRGHCLDDVIEAIQVAKDSGLKVTAHIMPNLFSSPEEDIAQFKQLYSDPRFKPDALKIYPCLLLEDTELFNRWKQGEYVPYSEAEVVRVLAAAMEITPPWVRIQRVQRDIPVKLTPHSIQYGNLRELAHALLKARDSRCHCIRCREVGHVSVKKGAPLDLERLELVTRRYKASEGEEYFLSFEDLTTDTLVSHLRLRIPSKKAYRPEICECSSVLVRELHVYGPMLEVGASAHQGSWQHLGLGRKLLLEAEWLGLQVGAEKIVVTSGIGAREYYERLGYQLEGPYEVKYL
ncbi:MAG: tRNA uridine(34) 5-carboxymethylaminomethyl modification radical SAM/GNAT enzyme Elp3 [Candidatus Heimdallarchaeota archaeon]